MRYRITQKHPLCGGQTLADSVDEAGRDKILAVHPGATAVSLAWDTRVQEMAQDMNLSLDEAKEIAETIGTGHL